MLTGYTPKVNRTILIDNNGRKIVVNDYKLLEISNLPFITI